MLKLNLKNWLAKTVGIMTALLAVNAMAAGENPYVLTQQASAKLFNDIKTNQSRIKQDPNYLKTIVHNNLMPYVHVNYAGSLVLGTQFKSTTPEQRTKFFAAFGSFIEQAYAQALTLYTNQNIDIEKAKDVSDKTIVKVRVNLIQGNQAPTKLDFSWRKNSKTGEWQVYDMAAEGVSMVVTKQNEWAATLRNKGIDALTAQVQQAANQPITLSK